MPLLLLRPRSAAAAAAAAPEPVIDPTPEGSPTQVPVMTSGRYRLPKAELLKTGAGHKKSTPANDQVVKALREVLDQFGIDAEVSGFPAGSHGGRATRSSSDRASKSSG